MKTTPFEIIQQGEIIVNEAHLIGQGDNVACIELSIDEGFFVVLCYGEDEQNAPLVTFYLWSIELCTTVSFPDFVGWEVWTHGLSDDYVKVCLVKVDND